MLCHDIKLIDMQGSRTEQRSIWKQTVVKNSPPESRISASKDLPNKFSPTRLNNFDIATNPLVKSKISHSQDEINLGSLLIRDRSHSKIQRGPITPRSIQRDSEIPYRGTHNSEQSIDFVIVKQQPNRVSYKAEDIDVVKQLKLQFLRFKEKILKELGRQESEIKVLVKQIYQALGKMQKQANYEGKQISTLPNLLKISSPSFAFNEEKSISKRLQVQAKPKIVLGGQTIGKVIKQPNLNAPLQTDNLFPNIRDRMGKCQDLISNLKKDLHESFQTDQFLRTE